MASPISRARLLASLAAIHPIEARAAAHAAGLPAYVPRGLRHAASITSARPVTADSGSPPAIPFAVVMRSGMTPHVRWRTSPRCGRTRIESSAMNGMWLARAYWAMAVA